MTRQVGVRLDPALERALEQSAKQHERRLAQEIRHGLRQYLHLNLAAEDTPEACDVIVQQ
jgi:hypothetical protein